MHVAGCLRTYHVSALSVAGLLLGHVVSQGENVMFKVIIDELGHDPRDGEGNHNSSETDIPPDDEACEKGADIEGSY